MSDHVELSLILLCYRSGEAIREMALQAKDLAASLTDRFEIVLVANDLKGSDDCTQEVVEDLAATDPCFLPVCKVKEGMMGWDMRSGLERASGNLLCVLDGDGQFPLESIKRCYQEITTREVGLVKTYRSSRGDGAYRILISQVYNRLFRLLFPGINSIDVNSKPKMMTRETFEALDLHSDDWFVDAEIMIQAGRHQIPLYEFPVEFYALSGRKSFVKPKAILEFIRNLIRFRIREWKHSPSS